MKKSTSLHDYRSSEWSAIVGHAFWSQPGGGQLVVAAAARGFADAGYFVVLAAVSRFDPSSYLEWYGIDIRGLPIVSSRFDIRLFGIYQRLVTYRYIEKAVKKYKADIVFTDEVFYKPLVRKKKTLDIKIIEYIHFPYEAIVYKEFREIIESQEESWKYIDERYGRFPLNIYWGVWLRLLRYSKRDNPFFDADLVLANSKWTGEFVKRIYGKEPIVLNPPLPPLAYPSDTPPGFNKRRKDIIMLGRFSEEKRYHWAVEEILPILLKEEPEARLLIIGSSGSRPSQAYVSRLLRITRRQGIRAERGVCSEKAKLCLLENLSRREVNKLMDSARVFLHATIGEHWGIAVAEAMARGLPVVVHRSGGAWTDLAGEGRYGVGYTTAEEAVEAVVSLLNDEKRWRYYSSRGRERAKLLSLESFREKLLALLERIS